MSNTEFNLENIIYRAGAGAGKTTTLVKHVVKSAEDFLKLRGRYPRMVIATFTRKATQELRERLLREAQERNRPELLQFFLSQRDLHISTIHGVLHLLLHRFGSRIHLDPGFSFLDPSESAKRSKKILRSLVYDEPKYEELLNLLGFNGIVQKVRSIEKCFRQAPEVRPHNLETLTLAVEEFSLRLANTGRSLALNIRSETSKSDWLEFAEFLEKISELLVNYFEHSEYLKTCFDGRRKPSNSRTKPTVSEELDEETKEFLGLLKSFDSDIFELENLKVFSDRYAELNDLARAYAEVVAEEKLRTGRIEIDDLELLSLKLLREHPDVAEAFSKEWDYWLIDEFQDTSPLQVELLGYMRGSRPHLVVGDPQQSIYFFRGARTEVFREKEKEIIELGGRRELLNRNYRSTPELLLFLNDLVQDFGVGFEPMLPKTETFTSSKCVAVFGKANDVTEEYNFIAKQIQDLIEQGVSLEKICILARKNLTLKAIAGHLNQFGISTQVHAASGFFDRREILDLLTMLKFLVNPHDNYNLVELLRTPWFRMPDQDIVTSAVNRGNAKDSQSLWSYIQRSMPENYLVAKLKSSLLCAQESGVISAFEKMMVSSGVIDASHYHDSTGQRESNIWKFLFKLRDESRKSNFHILSFIRNSQKTVDLEEFSSDSEASPAFEPNRVNLMTIHMSKGLQFEYVFVPQIGGKPESPKRSLFSFEEAVNRWCCELPMGSELKGSSPLNAKLHNIQLSEQEVLESERLFYVAVTRAKERVYLSFNDENSKESWLSKLRWPLEKTGEFNTEFYSYKIEEQPWVIKPVTRAQHRSNAAMHPVQFLIDSNTPQNISVSRVLNLWDQHQDQKLVSENRSSVQTVSTRIDKALKGTLVHKLFEALHYHGFEKANEFIRVHLASETKLALSALDFVQSNRDIPLKELIENGEAEWGFLARFGRTILEGQIDLWGKVDSTVWIVDYKTGHPQHSYRAQRQLDLYALAVKKSGIEGNFRLAAVFPMYQKVLIFDPPDFNTLEAKLNEM